MDTGTHSIKNIFGKDQRLVVPLFQRPYVWRQDLQWEPLWDDIRKVAERLLIKQPVRSHFLGAIVLDQIRQPIGRVDSRLIIDGQQRLTTIQLFLEAFADICASMKEEKYFKALRKLTRNDDPMSEDVNEVYKVWPTNIDQEHFCRVMEAGAPEDLRQSYGAKPDANSVNHTIADCYLYFHAEISKWLIADASSTGNKIEALYNTVREYLRMVVIDLDKEDDAQLIFETLNARGTPLLPSDLVKNFLFHRAEIEGEKIEKLYEKYWKSFDIEHKYWREEIGPGHAKRARLDLFLQNYLTLRTTDEVPSAHIYATFRQHAINAKVKPSQHLENVRHYADIYQSFSKFPRQSRMGLFFYRLDMLGVTTVYPFLLELFACYGQDDPELIKVLNYIEGYLVRRMICQLSTRAYSKVFLELLVVFSSDEGNISDRVKNHLTSYDAESNRWPKDAEFKQAWLEKPIYNLLLRQRARMLLEALELQLFTDLTESIEIKSNLTIEHIMPQGWLEHWALPKIENENKEKREKAEATRNRLIHTIGNLTLLTKKLNPSVSNSKWEIKKSAIQKHSALTLNRQICAYETWSEEMIEERGKNLFNVVTQIWSEP